MKLGALSIVQLANRQKISLNLDIAIAHHPSIMSLCLIDMVIFVILETPVLSALIRPWEVGYWN